MEDITLGIGFKDDDAYNNVASKAQKVTVEASSTADNTLNFAE